MPQPSLRCLPRAGRVGATAWAVALLAGLVGADADALSVGRLVTQSSLGQPLNLVFPLNLAAGDEPLTRDCVRADVMAGENRVPPGYLQFQLETEGEGGRVRAVRVLSTVPVDEPIVSISLALGCPTRFTRQFTAFIDPPEMRPTLQAAAPLPAPAPMPPVPLVVVPPPAPRPVPQTVADAASPALAPAVPVQRLAAAEPPPAPAPKPKPKPRPVAKAPSPVLAEAPTEPVEPRAKPSKPSKPVARLRLDPAELPAQALAAAASEAAASAPPPAPDPVIAARLELMEKQLSSVQLQHKLTEEQLKLVRAQLDAAVKASAQNERYPTLSILALILAVLGMGAAGFYLWRTRQAERQLREAVWWREEQERSQLETRLPPPPPPAAAPKPAPRVAESAAEFESQTLAGPLLDDLRARVEAEDAADTQAQTTPLPLMQDPVSFIGMPTRPMPMPVPVAAPAPSPSERVMFQLEALQPPPPSPLPPLPPLQPVPAMDAAPVSVEELIDLEQQVDFFMVLGQEEAAVDLLQARIDLGQASELPYLKLLEIHQRRGDGVAFAALAARFGEQFQVIAPAWGSALSAGRSLEDYRPVLNLLQQHWNSDAGASMALVQNLLSRGGEDAQGFELPAYRDLLMLYAVARDLSEREVRGGDIDVFLPLDSGSGAPGASPTSMMATMVWQASPALIAGSSRYGTIDVDITLDDEDTSPGVKDV